MSGSSPEAFWGCPEQLGGVVMADGGSAILHRRLRLLPYRYTAGAYIINDPYS